MKEQIFEEKTPNLGMEKIHMLRLKREEARTPHGVTEHQSWFQAPKASNFINNLEAESRHYLCYPGLSWSVVVQSQLTAAFASRVQAFSRLSLPSSWDYRSVALCNGVMWDETDLESRELYILLLKR
ncbi:hypothetical protein AAY473_015181 [Plecturocebus cupreus]